MIEKHLFLLGGSSFQPEAHKAFISEAGGSKAHLVLCILNNSGWEGYVRLFKDFWAGLGIESVEVIVPDQNDQLEDDIALKTLEQSTGIFIGGGDTIKYLKHYAEGDIGSKIKALYDKGIPIAGNSAGALILPDTTIVSPEDNEAGELLVCKGIGLFNNMLISVHHTEWNDKQNLLKGMKQLNIKAGLGIDEQACAHLINGEYVHSYGQDVHVYELK